MIGSRPAVVLFLLASANVLGESFPEIKREVQSNSEAIQAAEAEMDAMLSMPMGSLADRYRIQFKFPGRIKVVSSTHPGKTYVRRPDTNYLSPEASKDAAGVLMTALQPDKEGRLFNFLMGYADGSEVRSRPCGKEICIAIVKEIAPAMQGQDTSATGPKSASFDFTWSPKRKTITGFNTLAGAAFARTTIEYAIIGGIRVPTSLVMLNGATTLKLTFRNWALNGKVPDGVFK